MVFRPRSKNLPTPLFLALATVLAVSVAGQAVGAAYGSAQVSILAAAAFVAALIGVSWQANRHWWNGADTGREAVPDIEGHLARRTATLLSIGYLWGAISLAAVYLGTPLRWQHGWQYALAMALIGLAIYAGTRTIDRGWSPDRRRTLAWLTLIHGWAATGAILWLIASGKLFSDKADWAANVVFTSGAVVVAGLGAIWLRTSRLLSARTQR